MTNEEIVEQIIADTKCIIDGDTEQLMRDAAIEMAQIKDKAHKDELDMINAKIEDTQRQMKALNDLIESKSAKLKSAYQENSKCYQTIIAYEQKIISLKYDIEEAEKKLREAEKEQTEWKAVYQRQSGRLLEDNKDLQKKLDKANKLIETLGKELKESNDLLAAFQRVNNKEITEEWLDAHFEREEATEGRPTTWNDCDDYRDIEVRLYSDSIYKVKIHHCEVDTADDIVTLCTVGQLLQFLNICGVKLNKVI